MFSKHLITTLALSAFVLLGGAVADASEVTGTFGATSADSVSTTGGSIGAQVGGGSSLASNDASSDTSTGSGGGSGLGTHRSSLATSGGGGGGTSADDILIDISGSNIQSDGSLASATDFNGTGGGYDPELETLLAGQNDDGTLSPDDAIAFNSGEIPTNSLVAATAGAGNNGKLLVTVALGLALLGLAGYAVNSYVAYKKGL